MRTVLVAAIIALGTTSTAYAVTPCPAAVGELKPVIPKGKPKTTEFLEGLPVSLLLGLDPATFPQKAIAEQTEACTRGEFEVGGKTYVVYGRDGGSPPRWAMIEGGERIAFLALMPPPAAALKWARSKDRTNAMSFSEPPVYALAVTVGDKRDIFGVFETIPGDAELASLFQRALDGSLKPFARYDAATGETDF